MIYPWIHESHFVFQIFKYFFWVIQSGLNDFTEPLGRYLWIIKYYDFSDLISKHIECCLSMKNIWSVDGESGYAYIVFLSFLVWEINSK